jgi:hypothetical protein
MALTRYHIAVVAIFDRYLEADTEARAQEAAADSIAAAIRPIGLSASYLAALKESDGKGRRTVDRYLDRVTWG